MAKGSNSQAGCASTLIVLLPMWWAYDKCTGGDEKRAQEATQAMAAEANAQASRLAEAQQQARLEAQQKAAKEQQEAALRAARKAELAALKPYQRVQLVQQCAKGDCPEGTPDAAIVIEAAKTEGERKQLQAVSDQIEKAQARASSALRCCDGSDSPSCTCGGGSHRGCCSHHGGVCGCSADAP